MKTRQDQYLEHVDNRRLANSRGRRYSGPDNKMWMPHIVPLQASKHVTQQSATEQADAFLSENDKKFNQYMIEDELLEIQIAKADHNERMELLKQKAELKKKRIQEYK